jgi:hypothetical protein
MIIFWVEYPRATLLAFKVSVEKAAVILIVYL